MKSILLMAVLFAPLMSKAQVNTPEQSKMCVHYLVVGNYLPEDQAEGICDRFARKDVGCAMDLVDRNEAPDVYEGLEFCADPTAGMNPKQDMGK